MKIDSVNNGYPNSYNLNYNLVSNHTNTIQPAFYGLKLKKSLEDIFQLNTSYIKEITEIKPGDYGTTCKGSKPLPSFFTQFKNNKKEIEILKQTGISTNDSGCAYSFLKSKANKPLSTSFVHDCSVMYLYNEQKHTHFLYHIHKDENKEEISAIIKLFMPEGYTHASIVPGDKYWADTHKKYLPQIFSAIKEGSNNVKINVYHNSSERPEVVGYKGCMYEIPNKFYSKPYIERMSEKDRGQASFKIRDFRIYTTLYESNISNDVKELQKQKNAIKHSNQYTPELRRVLYNIIEERINALKELNNIKTESELNKYLESKGLEYLYGYPQIGKAGFYSAVTNKKKELGIMQ